MRLLRHELRYELLLYSRSRELAFFTFLLPMILFLLLGFAYGDEEIQGVKGSDYLLTGTLGYGVVATAFAGFELSFIHCTVSAPSRSRRRSIATRGS